MIHGEKAPETPKLPSKDDTFAVLDDRYMMADSAAEAVQYSHKSLLCADLEETFGRVHQLGQVVCCGQWPLCDAQSTVCTYIWACFCTAPRLGQELCCLLSSRLLSAAGGGGGLGYVTHAPVCVFGDKRPANGWGC
jgi:hypothetical protein